MYLNTMYLNTMYLNTMYLNTAQLYYAVRTRKESAQAKKEMASQRYKCPNSDLILAQGLEMINCHQSFLNQ